MLNLKLRESRLDLIGVEKCRMHNFCGSSSPIYFFPFLFPFMWLLCEAVFLACVAVFFYFIILCLVHDFVKFLNCLYNRCILLARKKVFLFPF